MAQKKVTVVLDPDTCAFSVDLNGFNGKGCGDVLRAFEKLGTVTASKKKPEYEQQTVNSVRQ